MTYLTDETMDEMSRAFELEAESSGDVGESLTLSEKIWERNTTLVTRHYKLNCRQCGRELSHLTSTEFGLSFDFFGGDVTFTARGVCDSCGESSGSVDVPPVFLVSTLTLAINSVDGPPF